MVQSRTVAQFFFLGIVSGIILTTILASYGIIDFIILSGHRTKILSTSKPDRFSQPLTHEELDHHMEESRLKETINFGDEHFHHDQDEVARELYKKVKVLCWVMTSKDTLDKKAKHVRATWGKRCNNLIFMSDAEDKNFPAVAVDAPAGYGHLTARTMKAFQYVYSKHRNDADWFMKVDDDTYVVVENLRYLLSTHKPSEPVFFGHHFKPYMKQGYFSGGGGYVISKEALLRFGNRSEGTCSNDGGAEDVEFGRCMEKLGVITGDSRDALGRSRFHCFNPQTHLRGGYPDWYYQYDKYGAQKGPSSMSDYPVTFHYVTPEDMYDIEYYVYHLRPYGISSGLQNINTDKEGKKS